MPVAVRLTCLDTTGSTGGRTRRRWPRAPARRGQPVHGCPVPAAPARGREPSTRWGFRHRRRLPEDRRRRSSAPAGCVGGHIRGPRPPGRVLLVLRGGTFPTHSGAAPAAYRRPVERRGRPCSTLRADGAPTRPGNHYAEESTGALASAPALCAARLEALTPAVGSDAATRSRPPSWSFRSSQRTALTRYLGTGFTLTSCEAPRLPLRPA
jgi:hypothetical protein